MSCIFTAVDLHPIMDSWHVTICSRTDQLKLQPATCLHTASACSAHVQGRLHCAAAVYAANRAPAPAIPLVLIDLYHSAACAAAMRRSPCLHANRDIQPGFLACPAALAHARPFTASQTQGTSVRPSHGALGLSFQQLPCAFPCCYRPSLLLTRWRSRLASMASLARRALHPHAAAFSDAVAHPTVCKRSTAVRSGRHVRRVMHTAGMRTHPTRGTTLPGYLVSPLCHAHGGRARAARAAARSFMHSCCTQQTLLCCSWNPQGNAAQAHAPTVRPTVLPPPAL